MKIVFNFVTYRSSIDLIYIYTYGLDLALVGKYFNTIQKTRYNRH